MRHGLFVRSASATNERWGCCRGWIVCCCWSGTFRTADGIDVTTTTATIVGAYTKE
ncbi:hypothetical protein EMPG_14938 [Blastomyces silverae]|uniref:Uncharacterized protein n=1 Tax=Blastomyces silverae TaxID=2060906 RepID=A0A0H1BE53_9EURO|nr:hypothetical protein EMPG_14938 [Blastomyces silverae]